MKTKLALPIIIYISFFIIVTFLIKFTFMALNILPLENAKLIVTIVAGFVTLSVTNVVTLVKSNVDHQLSLKKDILLKKILIEEERLSKFFDPISNLLTINEVLFSEFGPPAFPKDYNLALEAAEVWSKVRQTIKENNDKITEIITSSVHMIPADDNSENYTALLKHIVSYNFYEKSVNENHKFRQFPLKTVEHIKEQQRKISKNLNIEKLKFEKEI